MKGIIKIFLYVLLALIPAGVLLRIKVSPGIFIVPQDIVVALLFIFSFYYFIFIKRKLPDSKLILYTIISFVGVGVVSLLVNMKTFSTFSLTASLLYAWRYAAYAGLLFVGEIVPESFISIKKWFIWTGSFIIAIGFLQFLFYNNLRNLYYLGWDDHLYRLFSVFFDPNFAGAFYVIFIFIVLSFFSGKKLKFVFSGLIILATISVYLTYSRTAFIMLSTGVIMFLLLRRKIKEIVLILVLLVAGLVMFSDVKVEGLNPFRIASSKNRIVTAGEAWSIFTKHPLAGVGFNSYRYAQIHYGNRNVDTGIESNADAGTDNSYLFVFATTGVIGASFFVLYYVLILKELKKIKDKFVRDVWFSMFTALLVGSLFINLLFYTPILLVISLFTGFILQKKTKG